MRSNFFISFIEASIAAITLSYAQALNLQTKSQSLSSLGEVVTNNSINTPAGARPVANARISAAGLLHGKPFPKCDNAVLTKIAVNADLTQHIIPADEFYATPQFLGIGTIDTYNAAVAGDHAAMWSLTKNAIWKHFQITWEQTPRFAWPGPELEAYVDGTLSTTFYTSADQMLEAFVKHNCVDL